MLCTSLCLFAAVQQGHCKPVSVIPHRTVRLSPSSVNSSWKQSPAKTKSTEIHRDEIHRDPLRRNALGKFALLVGVSLGGQLVGQLVAPVLRSRGIGPVGQLVAPVLRSSRQPIAGRDTLWWRQHVERLKLRALSPLQRLEALEDKLRVKRERLEKAIVHNEIDAESLSRQTKDQLQQLLRIRGLRSSGNKAELVERILNSVGDTKAADQEAKETSSTDQGSLPTAMSELKSLKVVDLVKLLRENGLDVSGTKPVLLERLSRALLTKRLAEVAEGPGEVESSSLGPNALSLQQPRSKKSTRKSENLQAGSGSDEVREDSVVQAMRQREKALSSGVQRVTFPSQAFVDASEEPEEDNYVPKPSQYFQHSQEPLQPDADILYDPVSGFRHVRRAASVSRARSTSRALIPFGKNVNVRRERIDLLGFLDMDPEEWIDARVKRISEHGFSVHLLDTRGNAAEGFVDISKMRPYFVRDPNDEVSVGQAVKVRIIKDAGYIAHRDGNVLFSMLE